MNISLKFSCLHIMQKKSAHKSGLIKEKKYSTIIFKEVHDMKILDQRVLNDIYKTKSLSQVRMIWLHLHPHNFPFLYGQ
jgi:hypothetical protein